MPKISAILITLNEESNLERCLKSINWVDEIVVVDSGSTDKTLDIARRYTEKIYAIPWEGFGPAKNLALQKATSGWILSIDADEEISPELKNEILNKISSPTNSEGFYLPRKSCFLGKWLKYGGWYPDYVLRVFKKDKGRFEEKLVHESVKVEGKIEYLKNHILHYTDPDIEHYIKKMNYYTTLSARELHTKNQKASFFQILLRPCGVFFKIYFLKKGFLEGEYGLLLSIFSAFHVFTKYAKLWHLNSVNEK